MRGSRIFTWMGQNEAEKEIKILVKSLVEHKTSVQVGVFSVEGQLEFRRGNQTTIVITAFTNQSLRRSDADCFPINIF